MKLESLHLKNFKVFKDARMTDLPSFCVVVGAGENVLKVLEEFKDRIYLLHLKDFNFDKAGRKEDVVTGTGNLDLKALSKTLKETGFKGPYIIEYEGQPEDPVPALRQCVKNSKEALY